jgi:putative ABC transport system permease protein
LLFLSLVRGELIDQWQHRLSPDAPDHFIINVQPAQVTAVRQALETAGVASPKLAPMIRGRLIRIDDREVHSADYTEAQTRSLVEREFNLSVADGLPAGNRIVQGQWQADNPGEISIEEGIAKRLGVRVGQTLSFDIEGDTVSGRVSSIRQLDWDSMQVNFFVVLSPNLLQDRLGTYITAVHVPAGAGPALSTLVARFPNLTVIDVRSALQQVRALIDEVVSATWLLFVLALGAGWFVLGAALASTQDERRREAAILRALGASAQQLRQSLLIEMTLIGLLAGSLAVIVDGGVLMVFARRTLDLNFYLPWTAVGWSLLAAVLAALTSGALALRGVLSTPPLHTLREAA